MSGLGRPGPSRFPYPDRPQPSPGVGSGSSGVVRARQVIVIGANGSKIVITPGTSAQIALYPPGLPAGGQPGLLFAEDQGGGPGGQLVTVLEAPNFPGGATNPAILLTSPSQDGVSFPSSITFSDVSLISFANVTAVIAPSGDATGATDAATLNFALSVGYAVQLLPGTFYVNAPLEYPGGAVITGAGRSGISVYQQTTIQAAAAVDAVFCSSGWLEATNTQSQDPVTITGLKVNGNGLATYGIVSQNYDSLFADLEISNVTGDGIRFDTKSQSGSQTITGTAVNNRVRHCTFQSCGRGFATNEANLGSLAFTDGYLESCDIATVTGSAGVCIMGATGWHIAGNHLYGLPGHGIQLGQMYMTRVIGNYVETWGTSATASTYRGIDNFTFGSSDEGAGSVIAGNTLNLLNAPGNNGSQIEGITVNCLSNNSASFAITGNLLDCFPAAGFTNAYGIVLFNTGSASTLNITSTGNNLTGHWTAAVHQVPNGGTINLSAGV